jgi:cyclophilin family peptidyl-prolyl cis-trans isomerase
VPKPTRNRQLAKQHARRQAERRQHQRRRQTTTIAIALVIALVGSLAAFLAFTGGDEPPPAATGATEPTGATGPTGATAEPGTQTGTVQPEPGPDTVACGGEQPRTALRPKPQFSAPGDALEEGQAATAEIETSCGAIVVELFAEASPETVNSFVFLAEQGYFNGQRFHRLDTSISVVQGGDPTGTGTGGPGYSIPDELTGDELYEPGVLAMANAGPNTGGSQFFFVTGPGASGLPPSYTIFGRVIEGLVVLELIQQLPIQDPEAAAQGDLSGQQPAEAVYIEKVTIRQGG